MAGAGGGGGCLACRIVIIVQLIVIVRGPLVVVAIIIIVVVILSIAHIVIAVAFVLPATTLSSTVAPSFVVVPVLSTQAFLFILLINFELLCSRYKPLRHTSVLRYHILLRQISSNLINI